jgi:hypothetical protein
MSGSEEQGKKERMDVGQDKWCPAVHGAMSSGQKIF